MALSLDSLLRYTKGRLDHLQSRLHVVASQTYFPLLTDDILAVNFEFASLPPYAGTASSPGIVGVSTTRRSQESRWSRIAFGISRYTVARSLEIHRPRDAVVLRCAAARFEERRCRSYPGSSHGEQITRDRKKRAEELIAHYDWIASVASRIHVHPLRFLPQARRSLTIFSRRTRIL